MSSIKLREDRIRRKEKFIMISIVNNLFQFSVLV